MSTKVKIILGTLAITILGGGYFLYTNNISQVSDNVSFGDTIPALPAFRMSGNSIIPRDSDADFALGGTATSSAPFSWNSGPNLLTLTNITITGTCTGCGGGGGASALQIRDIPGAYNGTPASLSFNGGAFTLTASGSTDVTVKLDWGAGGPASLSEAETITGNWVNTANPWADNEVVDTLTINGGTVTWTDLTSYPTGCTNQFVVTIGDTLTCATVDISDMTNLTAGAHLTLTGDDLSVDDDYLFNTGDTATGLVIFSAGASVTTNFEVSGTASISSFRLPSTAGGILGDCDAAGDTLNWDTTTGKFTCGTDASGGGVSSNSLNFDEFQAALVVDTDTTITGGAFALTFDHASVSGNFELTGAGSLFGVNAGALINSTLEIGGTASVSGAATFGSTASVTGNFEVGSNKFRVDAVNGRWGFGATTLDGTGSIPFELVGTASISGSIRIHGGNIQDSSGANRIALGTHIEFNNDIVVSGNDIRDASEVARISIPNTGQITFTGRASVTQSFEATNNIIAQSILQVGGLHSSSSYSRFGTALATNSPIASSNDLLISGDLEVGQKMFMLGTASISGNLEVTGKAFFGDTASVAGNFEVGSNVFRVMTGVNDFLFSIASSSGTFFHRIASSGHEINDSDTEPTLTTCTNMGINGTDGRGLITASGANTSCLITFTKRFDSAPSCLANVSVGVADVDVFTTAENVTFSGYTLAAGNQLHYDCEQVDN